MGMDASPPLVAGLKDIGEKARVVAKTIIQIDLTGLIYFKSMLYHNCSNVLSGPGHALVVYC